MKKTIFSVLTLAIMAFGLTSCNDENKNPEDPNNDANKPAQESHVTLSSHARYTPVDGGLDLYGAEDGYFDIDLSLLGGITFDELNQFLTSGGAVPKDMVMLYLDLGSTEEEAIPSGSYVVDFNGADEADRRANGICYAEALVVPQGTDMEAAEDLEPYMVISGTLEVVYSNGNYTLDFTGKLKDGSDVTSHYEGALTVLYDDREDGDLFAPAFTKKAKRNKR